jgi:hypothetical protein
MPKITLIASGSAIEKPPLHARFGTSGGRAGVVCSIIHAAPP